MLLVPHLHDDRPRAIYRRNRVASTTRQHENNLPSLTDGKTLARPRSPGYLDIYLCTLRQRWLAAVLAQESWGCVLQSLVYKTKECTHRKLYTVHE